MTLTQFIRIFFRDKKNFHTIDEKTKASFFFMFNRLIARLYPTSASNINFNGVDTHLAIELWFDVFKNKYSDTPPNFSPNWGKLKSKSSDKILNGFSDRDKEILSLYPELIESVKKEEKENEKLAKEGFVKITKKRGKKPTSLI